MVIDTVGEEDSLCINKELIPLFSLLLNLLTLNDFLQHLANLEVIFSHLVKHNVSSAFCRLRCVIEEGFVVETQRVPIGNLIS